MRGESEFEPGGVGLEGVKRQERGAGRLQRHDPVLDLGVLAVGRLQCADLRVRLVGDEALETVVVHVSERQLRAGVRAVTTKDQPGTLRPVGWLTLPLSPATYRRADHRLVGRRESASGRMFD